MDTNESALDGFDRQILQRYQHDTRLSADAIGAQVGLSAAAVQRRLKRMRENGVIRAEVAQIAGAALGLPLTCIVGVDLEREGASDIDRFKAKMSNCLQVQQCYYVTGQADFILVVIAADMAAYEAFTRNSLLDDDNVRSFTTHVVLDATKTGTSLPIVVG
jgi:Lrp/AsnC family transcriptional regulator, leucine-responsive regulatory protein